MKTTTKDDDKATPAEAAKEQEAEEEEEDSSPLQQLADEMDSDIAQRLDKIGPAEKEVPAHVCDVTDLRLFSLFDGHGGSACARRSAMLMNRFVTQKILDLRRDADSITDQTLTGVLENVFADFHKEHCRTLKSGATASLAVLCRKIVALATIGDSRCVLFRVAAKKLEVLWESPEHNTSNDDEVRRLKSEGVELEMHPDDVPRFPTGLSVTRTLGDSDTREVTRLPDVFVHTRSDDERLVLVMASDGMWDTVSTEEVADALVDRLEDVQIFEKTATFLCHKAYEAGSDDNISVQVVGLGLFAKKSHTNKK